MSSYDIAVVGAGAAGLAAGLALKGTGKSTIVVEARSRIGGRAYTDATSLAGIPFDQGAHWLHAAAQNPFTAIARKLGRRFKSDIDWSHHEFFLRTGRIAGSRIANSAERSLVTALDAVYEAGAEGRDVAYSDVIDMDDPWITYTRRVIHQITSHEPEDCSTLDTARYEDEGGDYPVEDGYGALVAANAGELPVTLSTPVEAIDWSGADVKLATPRGTVTARAIILAVPVNVLIAGAIRFTPALPVSLEQAFHDCPMGISEKFAMLLDRPIEGLGHLYGDIIDAPPFSAPPLNMHVNPFGRPLLVCHFGGNVGRDLERAGEDAMRALALENITAAFGAGMRKRVVKTLMTHWQSDPFTRGGYSHCRPGRAAARTRFGEPVGNRIFLAGEHCSIPYFSTVHGAHLSGIEAATRVLTSLAAPN